MKRKPILGETLFELNVGNEARRRPQTLNPVVVKKVGRKYFVCGRPDSDCRFLESTHYIESWRQKTEYSETRHLYETEQEWADEKEALKLTEELRREFGGYGHCGIKLEDLRAIKAILDRHEPS
jgi:hypothetical protein